MQSRAEALKSKISKRVMEVKKKIEEIAERLANNQMDTLEKVVDELQDTQLLGLTAIYFEFKKVEKDGEVLPFQVSHDVTLSYSDESKQTIHYSPIVEKIDEKLFEKFIEKIKIAGCFSVEVFDYGTYLVFYCEQE